MERVFRGGKMTLEELEIVVKADISDVTNKLNQLKEQLQGKVQGAVSKAVAETKPAVESIKTTISNTTSSTSKEIEIITRTLDLQAKKVDELKKKMQEYNRYVADQQKLASGKLGAQEYTDLYSKYVGQEAPKDYSTQLEAAQIQLDKTQLRVDKLKEKMAKVGQEAQKTSEKTSKSMQKVSNTVEKTHKHTSKLLMTLQRMGRIMLIRGVINAARQGFQDLAAANADFNQAMSGMQSSMIQVRNSIATAFAPAIESLAPIIMKVADAVSWLFTQLSMWGNAFAGNSTYTRAKKVTTDYAVSLGKATNEQKKANAEQKKMLAGFDELNVLMEKTSNSAAGGTGLPTATEMFEEIAIPQDVLDKATAIKQKFEELKPVLLAIAGIIAGWKLGKEIDNLGQLFGLWGSSKKPVNDLANAFRDKNSALGDQQEEYAKESSWLKNLIPQFAKAGISVSALGWALKNIKNNPIQMPSLEPVNGLQTAFNNATETAKGSLPSINEALQTAFPVFSFELNLIKGLIENIAKATSSTLNTEISNQEETVSNGFTNMADDAENLSISIQKSVKTFITNTAKNISNWITNSIEPAIDLMKAMNSASGGELFDTSGVSKTVKKVRNLVKELDSTLVSPSEKTYNGYTKEEIGEALRNSLYSAKNKEALQKANSLVAGYSAGTALSTSDLSLLENLFKKGAGAFGFASGGVVDRPTLALIGESASATPEIVTPQKLLLETSTQANVPVMNSIEEMGDRIISALNNIGVYAEFDYSKLKVGLDNENYRVGGKLYGV